MSSLLSAIGGNPFSSQVGQRIGKFYKLSVLRLLIQNQQSKHQNNMWNLFKVTIKDTIKDNEVNDTVLVSLLLTLNRWSCLLLLTLKKWMLVGNLMKVSNR